MIQVIICDDQEIVREGLQLILETDAEIQIIGLAQDGAEAVELVERLQPRLVLMDLKMPGMNGVEATRLIRNKFPHIYVLVLTTLDTDAWVFDAIRSGASGYLLKDTPRQQLIAAVKDTVQGKVHVDPSVAGKLLTQISKGAASPDTFVANELSERETEILKLVARGFTNTEIAAQLYLSEGTVRNYASSIFAKLGVTDRTQAAIKALRYGLVNLNDLS